MRVTHSDDYGESLFTRFVKLGKLIFQNWPRKSLSDKGIWVARTLDFTMPKHPLPGVDHQLREACRVVL